MQYQKRNIFCSSISKCFYCESCLYPEKNKCVPKMLTECTILTNTIVGGNLIFLVRIYCSSIQFLVCMVLIKTVMCGNIICVVSAYFQTYEQARTCVCLYRVP